MGFFFSWDSWWMNALFHLPWLIIYFKCYNKILYSFVFSIKDLIHMLKEIVLYQLCHKWHHWTSCLMSLPRRWYLLCSWSSLMNIAMYCLQWQTDRVYEPHLNLDFNTLLKRIISLKFYVTNKSLKLLSIVFLINLLQGIPFTLTETSMEAAVALRSGICRKTGC